MSVRFGVKENSGATPGIEVRQSGIELRGAVDRRLRRRNVAGHCISTDAPLYVVPHSPDRTVPHLPSP
jgi:hypothetical protein